VGDKFENFHGCYLILANGQYFAGAMQIAPHARLDDGLLNLVTVGDVSKSELLRIVPTVYDGSHIGHSKIREEKVTVVTMSPMSDFSWRPMEKSSGKPRHHSR